MSKSNKTKIKLYRKQIAKPTEQNISAYKKFKNMYNSTLRKAESIYLENLFNKCRRNLKDTWNNINNLLGRGKGKNFVYPKTFVMEKKEFNSTEQIVEGFNNYFTDIGENLQRTIKNSNPNLNINSYLGAKKPYKFKLKPISEDTLLKIIKQLKPKASTGQDKINNIIIKECFPKISLVLLHLINLSIVKGIVPVPLKTSRIVPVFKEG